MTPEQRAARAVAVRALLEDQNVKDAFASIEQDLMDEWKACHDSLQRDNLWRAVQIVGKLQTWLRSAASHDLTSLRRVA